MKRIIVKTLDDLDHVMRVIRDDFDANGPMEILVQDLEQSRSLAQNRLAFMWYKEAAEQIKDYDAEGYRGLCKLHVGVAIRKEKEKFCDVYDRVIKPLTYEQKIECMKEPINFPITSEMGVKEMSRYLEGVETFLSEAGVVLSKPEDMYADALGKHIDKVSGK